MTAIVPNHALGLPGGPGGIEDVKRVCCLHRHTPMRRRRCHLCLPIEIAAGGHGSACLGTLENNAEIRLVARQCNRLIQQRFVFHHPPRLDPAGCTDDCLGGRIIESHRKFVGGKPTEDDRVDSAQAGTGEHGDNGLGHHRHIHDDPISFTDTACRQNPCKGRDSITQFRKRKSLSGLCHRGVINKRRAVAVALINMQVQRVVAGVEFAAGKPSVIRGIGIVQHPIPSASPVNVCCRFRPELLGILKRRRKDF